MDYSCLAQFQSEKECKESKYLKIQCHFLLKKH